MDKQFQYNDPTPQIGQNLRKIQTRFQPQGWFSGGATAQPGQYIRFNFNTDGYWDPKSLYLYAEIDCSGMPVDCIYQLDNSAQSLIGQYIARIRGVEMERVQEYDSLAAKLYDMNIGISDRGPRAMEGLGTTRTISQPMFTRANNSGQPVQINGITTFGVANAYSASNAKYPLSLPTSAVIPISNVCGSFKPYIGMKLYMSDQELASNTWNINVNGPTTQQLPQLMNFLDMFNCNDIEGHESFFTSQDTSIPMLSNHGQAYLSVLDYGFTRVTQSCVGTGEWWCSSTIPKNTIKSGLPCYEANSYGNFSFPLLSTLFGSVSTHGKLLPMKAFQGLELEFLLNPFAFFVGGGNSVASKHEGVLTLDPNTGAYSSTTSSYSIANNLFSSSTSTNIGTQRTAWKMTKFELVVDVYYPDKPQDDAYMRRLEQEGFALDIKQWYLGPKIRYANGSSLSQTIQINNGFNSLCALDFYFEPADYEIYPWCRKHKRISGNVTSVQLRIGNEYFPSLPIVGHTGNIKPDYLSQTTKGNYVEFYQKTMACFGKFHNMTDNTIINASNYCTNHVGYNPAAYGTGGLTSNNDVFYGSSLFFENNHVPRSLIALDLEKVDLEGKWRSGWDTTGTRPFDLIIQTDTTPVTVQNGSQWINRGGVNNVIVTATTFPRPLYLVVWMLYDSRITWNAMEGWKSEGRV